MRTMRDSIVSAPTLSARITKLPVPLTVPPITRAPGAFSTGMDSPVTMDSSIALVPSSTLPSTGTRFARPHAQSVADPYDLKRHIHFAIGLNAPRGLGREFQQRPDRAAGALARAQFQNLTQQHQHGDDGGGFEIDRHHPVLRAVRPETGRARRSRPGCNHRQRRRPARSG